MTVVWKYLVIILFAFQQWPKERSAISMCMRFIVGILANGIAPNSFAKACE